VTAVAIDVEAELDRLFELRPEEFVAARNDLATRVKDEGDRERADEIKRLRKPTLAVWIVNRLARERELDVQRLAKAGEALMHGQGGAKDEREEEQRTLARLVQAAHDIAAREKIGSGAVDRAIETLRAAALLDEERDLLRRARLAEELEPPGLEALAALASSAPPARRARRSDGRKELQEARARLREAEKEERALAAAAREAEQQARESRARADRAARQRAEAEEEVQGLERG
jgi:hypothetical protein